MRRNVWGMIAKDHQPRGLLCQALMDLEALGLEECAAKGTLMKGLGKIIG